MIWSIRAGELANEGFVARPGIAVFVLFALFVLAFVTMFNKLNATGTTRSDKNAWIRLVVILAMLFLAFSIKLAVT